MTLERVHEEESESQVNRLARELGALRRRVHVQDSEEGEVPHASEDDDPSTAVLLAALREENESLRSRLVVAEREYVRVRRLNEVYREELIEHRRRVSCSRLSRLNGIT